MIQFFKNKLGISLLEKQIAILQKENVDYKEKLKTSISSAIKVADEYRAAQTKVGIGQLRSLIDQLNKKLDKHHVLVTAELISQARTINEKNETLKQAVQATLNSIEKTNNYKIQNLAKLLQELTDIAKELTNTTEKEISKLERSMQGKMWIQTGNFFEETETETLCDLTVLDKNYIKALFQNKIPNCYNSSDIKHIPNNYATYFGYPLKEVGTGMQNRHCYDNALLFGQERNEAIHIGVIIPKTMLEKAFQKPNEKLLIAPFLHAWNMTNFGQIADYTLGYKRGLEFVYIGRPLGSIEGISAKGLEEILRKETT